MLEYEQIAAPGKSRGVSVSVMVRWLELHNIMLALTVIITGPAPF